MGQTISEKILSRATGRPVKAGEIIYPKPDLVTCHDWYVVNFDKALQEFGVTKLFDPSRVLISTDHEPVAVAPASSERQKRVREIVAKYDITQFYDVGRGGLGHIFPIEMGFIRPGMFVEAYDTHVTNYGAVGCLGIAFVVEVSEIMALGSVWMKVPETVRVNLHGKLQPGTSMRDVAQKLIADLGDELIDYTVVEFGGPGMIDIDISGRHTLCNTPLEIGAKSALVEPDEATLAYLKPRTKEPLELVKSDADAVFRKVIDYDLNKIGPQVAVPPTPDNVHPIDKALGTPIQHAFIGSCASGNFKDLADAAAILKDRRHPSRRPSLCDARNSGSGAGSDARRTHGNLSCRGCDADPGGLRPLRRRTYRRDGRRRNLDQHRHAQRPAAARRFRRRLSGEPADGRRFGDRRSRLPIRAAC